MLRYLKIQNLAVIDEAVLELEGGFVSLTGESGAGKSVLVDALLLLSGGRASSDLVRAGCKKAVVEAEFEIEPREDEELDLLDGEQLFLRREVTAEGKSRGFVNGTATPNALLARYADLAFELHGQHGQQKLLQEKRHLQIFDEQTGLAEQAALFNERRRAFSRTFADYWDARDGEAGRLREMDMLRMQLQEIEEVDPNEEDLDLDARLKRAENAEFIRETKANLLGLLEERLTSDASLALKLLDQLGEFEPHLAPYREQVEGLSATLSDLAGEIDVYGDDEDGESLPRLEQRMADLHRLFMKYGRDVEEVLQEAARMRVRLEELEQIDEDSGAAWDRLGEAYAELLQARAALDQARGEAAPGFAARVCEQLSDLALFQAEFEVALDWPAWPEALPEVRELSLAGAVGRFLFSPNPGEPPRPLAKAASGGELSRVLLALICAFERKEAKALIFDEVDAGIGGETAHAVGAKLAYLGRAHQVLCVTHLAQVARFADLHVVLTKRVQEGRTTTGLHICDHEQRVAELARLMGGDAAAESLRDHAREMLEAARS